MVTRLPRLGLVAADRSVGLERGVPFAILPIDKALFDQVERLLVDFEIFLIPGQMVHVKSADNRLGLSPPDLDQPIGRLIEPSAVIETAILFVIPILQRVVEERPEEVEKWPVGDAGGFTGIDEQPDILEIVTI